MGLLHLSCFCGSEGGVLLHRLITDGEREKEGRMEGGGGMEEGAGGDVGCLISQRL